MSESANRSVQGLYAAIAMAIGIIFLYAAVLTKLASDWWTDENYSHGLLVPFVIAFILWNEREYITGLIYRPSKFLGVLTIISAFFLYIAGTLGAELFTQRISLLVLLAGIVVFLFGIRVINALLIPFMLLLLAIPIPQIIFNRIAFPLQIWASQMAVWTIRIFDVPTLRKGNVIDILPSGSTQTISLEVVEACSGIRSLMTLVTLALILGYFTRGNGARRIVALSMADLWRTLLLMIAAVPIAVVTNAGRVAITGIMTFYYGKRATEGTWHDVSGWLVYVVALGLLLLLNYLLKTILKGGNAGANGQVVESRFAAVTLKRVAPIVAAMLIFGVAVNWFVNRGEADVERKPLSEVPMTLGDWKQRGGEIKFGEAVESVLKTSDYTMREYTLPDGRIGNLYVGYYASQRTGATYHSPQNCLPGAGWVMKEPQYVDIPTADGGSFKANKYIIENGIYNEVMIYWYQGRGRIEASEYNDKLNTIWDSVTRRRSDGAMVRVMTSVGHDENAAVNAAIDLSSKLESTLSPYVPE